MTNPFLVFTFVLALVACSSDAGEPSISHPSGAVDGGAGTAAAGAGGSNSGAGGAAAGSGGGTATGAGAGSGGADAGGVDAGTSSAGAGGSSMGSAGAGGTVCIGSRPDDYAAPMLDKSCDDPDDCFVGLHTADCCTSQVALAFNQSEQAAFEQYESGCNLNPPCPCPAHPPVAEDGSPLPPGVSAIAECVAGGCLARSPDADECSGMLECVDAEGGGGCVAATGPTGNGRCRGSDEQCFACRCASPDTPVATPEGEKPIASLKVGDLVYSIDGEGIRAVPIVRVSRVAAYRHEVMRVQLANGRTIEISPGHPTADGGSFAELSADDRLGDVAVVDAALVDYTHAFTYDILPASSTGTYFAAGVPIGSTLF